MSQKLWIFARFPVPGQAKTRLVPLLGAERAAQLHRAMTQRTMNWARRLSDTLDVDVEVSLAGGTPDLFAKTFDPALPCRPQEGTDLGDRMRRAFAEAFASNAQKVVIVGTDAPALDESIVAQAFDSLTRCDLVLGPAWDGGYYLIGLARPVPVLFDSIAWGTEQVLAQTLARAADADLSVAYLSALGDVDRPEDLRLWTETTRQPIAKLDPRIVSIVIPTFQEAGTLARTVRPLLANPDTEVIVADGGSTDATLSIARDMGVTFVTSSDGRGGQVNLGASIARGASLVILHADTRLPDDFAERVRTQLDRPGVAGGAFRFAVDEPAAVPWLIRWGTNARSRWLSLPFGDQAIFTRTETFWGVGGCPTWPLLDDVALVRRLAQQGRIVLDDAPAITSARRWKTLGPWKTWWINQQVLAGYLLGVSPERLAYWYRQQSRRSP